MAISRFFVATSKTMFADDGKLNVGVVEVYDGRSHEHLFSIPNPHPVEHDRFGRHLALSGSLLAVTSDFADVSGDLSTQFVYIFDLASATPEIPCIDFEFQGVIHPAGAVHPTGLQLDGNRLAVSMPWVTLGVDPGAALVYDINSPQSPLETIIYPGQLSYAQFGSSLAMSGNFLAVGARYDGAYVFDLESAAPGNPVLAIPEPSGFLTTAFADVMAIEDGRLVIADPLYGNEGYYWGECYFYDLANADPVGNVVTIQSADRIEGEIFGSSLAISDGILLAGAPQWNAWPVFDGGAAYLFDPTSASPDVAISTIENPTPQANGGDFFGEAVSIDGTWFTVSAPSDRNGGNVGAAYVYSTAGPGPTLPVSELSTLTGVETRLGFGSAVATSERYIAVGSWHAYFNPYPYVVTVYDRQAADPWTPILEIEEPGDGIFGFSLDLDGHHLVVGRAAPDSDPETVYVYDLASPSPETPLHIIPNPNGMSDDRFGGDLAIEGDWLIVGAPHKNHLGSGAVYIYDLSSTTPTVPAATIDNPNPGGLNDYANFGWSVAMDSGRFVVGAIRQDDYAGAAMVYDLSDGISNLEMIKLPHVDNPNTFSDEFGYDVDIDGDFIVVGARQKSPTVTWEGKVYVYDIGGVNFSTTSQLSPTFSICNPTPVRYEEFGYSVSIDDGLLAVGSWKETTFGEDSGATYVFDLTAAAPQTPLAELFPPDTTVHRLGAEVSLSPNLLVVGAPWGSYSSTRSGGAFVYEVVTSDTFGPEAFTLTSGVVRSGTVNELVESDDQHLVIERNRLQVQSVCELEVEGFSSIASPRSLKVTVESGVFARSEVAAEIDLFDFESDQWELVDSRPAARFNDIAVTVAPSGDVSRFIEPGTGRALARIRFRTSQNRELFSARIDHVLWELE